MNSYSIYNDTVLMSGGSGRLGKRLVEQIDNLRLLAPSHRGLDISSYESVDSYFNRLDLKNIIFLNCAALVGETEARENPELLYLTNVMGVQNVKRICLKYNCFLMQISSDYVFDGNRGSYSEKDYPHPVTQYGWSKLIGEEILYDMNHSLILRMSFVDPENLKFPKALVDQYSSRELISNICEDIHMLLIAISKGVSLPKILHIGAERRSQYEFYKTFRPDIMKKSLKDIPFKLPVDVSFDISLWKKTKPKLLKHIPSK